MYVFILSTHMVSLYTFSFMNSLAYITDVFVTTLDGLLLGMQLLQHQFHLLFQLLHTIQQLVTLTYSLLRVREHEHINYFIIVHVHVVYVCVQMLHLLLPVVLSSHLS